VTMLPPLPTLPPLVLPPVARLVVLPPLLAALPPVPTVPPLAEIPPDEVVLVAPPSAVAPPLPAGEPSCASTHPPPSTRPRMPQSATRPFRGRITSCMDVLAENCCLLKSSCGSQEKGSGARELAAQKLGAATTSGYIDSDLRTWPRGPLVLPPGAIFR
jgi:hypothetical protein